MKVQPSVKKICEKCKIIKRKGRVWLFAKIQNINKNKDNLIGGGDLMARIAGVDLPRD